MEKSHILLKGQEKIGGVHLHLCNEFKLLALCLMGATYVLVFNVIKLRSAIPSLWHNVRK